VKNRICLRFSLSKVGAGKIDFADCYLAAVPILDETTLISFDRDFDKLQGVTRKQPKEAL
jgi:predicted nucleic acid-binding protein